MFSTQLSGRPIGTPGSYNNNGFTIDKVFDGSLDTYFDGPKGNDMWVGLDLGEPKYIDAIMFAPRKGWSQRMVGGVFQASDAMDFSSGVVDLLTVEVKPTEGVLSIATLDGSGAFRYVRFLSPKGGYGNITDMRVFGMATGIPQPAPAPAPKPEPAPAPVPTPGPRRAKMGIILESNLRPPGKTTGPVLHADTAAFVRSTFERLGHPPIRWWQSFHDVSTGAAWEDGLKVFTEVSKYKPTKDSMCTITPADAAVKAGFKWDDVRIDKVAAMITGRVPTDVILTLWNEANNPHYSPWGDLKGAARAGVREMPKLKVKGHKVFGPSITYRDPGGTKSLLESIRDEYKEFDGVCASLYGLDAGSFRAQLRVWRDFADSIGKPLALTEWGWAHSANKSLSDEAWAGELSGIMAAVAEYADYAYFYMYNKPDDGTPAKWVQDLRKNVRSPYADAFDVMLVG